MSTTAPRPSASSLAASPRFFVEGKLRKGTMIALRPRRAGCDLVALAVVVDDDLVERHGKGAAMIFGGDYKAKERVAKYIPDPRRCVRARISGLGTDGRRVRSANVIALLDRDTLVCVIGTELAARLGGATVRCDDTLDGRTLPIMAAETQGDAHRLDELAGASPKPWSQIRSKISV